MTPFATHPLVFGAPPPWARGWGQDHQGVFVELHVGPVNQRMRWLPPGKFQMGSPATEAGRFEWEGPRHQVELTDGFWLADTPCTQELWEEVMERNPSRFPSLHRPVEQVSWDDCQTFLQTVNSREPGLELRLPTEAEWEYACRAGTETATWLGDLEILGANHAPLLDSIAWYGGNSGEGFDLEKGWYDSSGWSEKQFPHERAGSREVAQKASNPWGLHDMLGNVWEWCQDFWADSYPGGPRINPTGPRDGAFRVFRGGAWGDDARDVRAACRGGIPPGDRYERLGFRLARGQGRGAWSGE